MLRQYLKTENVDTKCGAAGLAGGTFLARARVGVRVCPPFCASRAYCESRISVNAAGVAEIAPPIFDMQGPPLLTTPQYFDMCFIFFPSAELLNTAKSLSFSSAMRPVYSFNSTVEQNSLQTTTCLLATIYIQSLWRHGFASLYRSLGTNWYFYKVYHTTTIHATRES